MDDHAANYAESLGDHAGQQIKKNINTLADCKEENKSENQGAIIYRYNIITKMPNT